MVLTAPGLSLQGHFLLAWGVLRVWFLHTQKQVVHDPVVATLVIYTHQKALRVVPSSSKSEEAGLWHNVDTGEDVIYMLLRTYDGGQRVILLVS